MDEKRDNAQRFFETGNVDDYLRFKRSHENKKRLEMAYLNMDMKDYN